MQCSGTNSSPKASSIHERWGRANQGTGRITGPRAALIKHFRGEADTLIATEAAVEGVNLQFCSLVLGTLESEVDFEKRILAIYQTCRTPIAVDAAFAGLRAFTARSGSTTALTSPLGAGARWWLPGW